MPPPPLPPSLGAASRRAALWELQSARPPRAAALPVTHFPSELRLPARPARGPARRPSAASVGQGEKFSTAHARCAAARPGATPRSRGPPGSRPPPSFSSSSSLSLSAKGGGWGRRRGGPPSGRDPRGGLTRTEPGLTSTPGSEGQPRAAGGALPGAKPAAALLSAAGQSLSAPLKRTESPGTPPSAQSVSPSPPPHSLCSQLQALRGPGEPERCVPLSAPSLASLSLSLSVERCAPSAGRARGWRRGCRAEGAEGRPEVWVRARQPPHPRRPGAARALAPSEPTHGKLSPLATPRTDPRSRPA